MNEHISFERFVGDRFAEVEGARPPGQSIDDILLAARRMRPLPRWLATVKEPSMRISSRVAVGSPIARVMSFAMLVMILSAMTAGGVAVGATLLASPSPNGPLTLVVAQDGSGDFTTITEAIAVARDGDTVSVRPGTYQESVLISNDVSVVGDGPAGTVIIEFALDGPIVSSVLGGRKPYGIALNDSNGHLANLTVRGPVPAAGVWVSGGSPTLEGLSVAWTGRFESGPPASFEFVGGTTATLRDATATCCLAIGRGASPTIERLELDGGGFISGEGTQPLIRDSGFAWALDIEGGAAPTIERNQLLGLKVVGSSPMIRDNTFANPDFVAGVQHSSSEEATAIEIVGGAPTIVGNRIGDHEVGISVGLGSTPTVTDNRIEANTTGIEVVGSATSPILSGNTFCDNGTDLAVPEGSAVTLDGNTVCEPGTSSTP
jgi:parallel beta-helix repeat protein